MTLGEKIKKARLDRNMTQKQLAGSFITRNMLSKIENNCSSPSLKTIEYLSARLNLPSGYLMSEHDDDFICRRDSGIDDLRALYKEKKYSECLSCASELDSGKHDDEIMYICAQCAFYCAEAEFESGNAEHAKKLFLSAMQYAGETVYSASFSLCLISSYISALADIKNENGSESETASDDPGMESDKKSFERILYCDILKLFHKGLYSDPKDKDSLNRALCAVKAGMIKNTVFAEHLRALSSAAEGDYKKSSEMLESLLSGCSTGLSQCDRNVIMRDCEKICAECGDFERAYKYSNKLKGKT